MKKNFEIDLDSIEMPTKDIDIDLDLIEMPKAKRLADLKSEAEINEWMKKNNLKKTRKILGGAFATVYEKRDK